MSANGQSDYEVAYEISTSFNLDKQGLSETQKAYDDLEKRHARLMGWTGNGSPHNAPAASRAGSLADQWKKLGDIGAESMRKFEGDNAWQRGLDNIAKANQKAASESEKHWRNFWDMLGDLGKGVTKHEQAMDRLEMRSQRAARAFAGSVSGIVTQFEEVGRGALLLSGAGADSIEGFVRRFAVFEGAVRAIRAPFEISESFQRAALSWERWQKAMAAASGATAITHSWIPTALRYGGNAIRIGGTAVLAGAGAYAGGRSLYEFFSGSEGMPRGTDFPTARLPGQVPEEGLNFGLNEFFARNIHVPIMRWIGGTIGDPEWFRRFRRQNPGVPIPHVPQDWVDQYEAQERADRMANIANRLQTENARNNNYWAERLSRESALRSYGLGLDLQPAFGVDQTRDPAGYFAEMRRRGGIIGGELSAAQAGYRNYFGPNKQIGGGELSQAIDAAQRYRSALELSTAAVREQGTAWQTVLERLGQIQQKAGGDIQSLYEMGPAGAAQINEALSRLEAGTETQMDRHLLNRHAGLLEEDELARLRNQMVAEEPELRRFLHRPAAERRFERETAGATLEEAEVLRREMAQGFKPQPLIEAYKAMSDTVNRGIEKVAAELKAINAKQDQALQRLAHQLRTEATARNGYGRNP